MKINMKKALVITKINFVHMKIVYIITAFLFAIGIYNIVACCVGLSDNHYIDMANYLYMLAVLAPIMISACNFKKIIHLNGKKLDFYWGSLFNYVIIAAFVSFTNLILYMLADTILGSRVIILNLVDIFGWYNHGMMIAFIQQFVFILLIEVFVHTLTNMQSFWYGWLIDILLITIISIFIPVPKLRKLLVGFFNLIIFHKNDMVQIGSCFILTAGIYTLNLFVLKRRKV